jgi:hypothetical protein
MKVRDHFTGAGKPILQLVTFYNRLYVGISTVLCNFFMHSIAQLLYGQRPSFII